VSKESNKKSRAKKKAAGYGTIHVDMLGGKFGAAWINRQAAKFNKMMTEKIG